jgi:2',3'-cyclic-nucleotide 2'-phosphodiesterase (5'-nucleotidase family)
MRDSAHPVGADAPIDIVRGGHGEMTKIELKDKKSALRSAVFAPTLLLVLRKKKEATVTEIRDAMITVLKEPVDSAPVYLTVDRFINRDEPLIKAGAAMKKGQARRFMLTRTGDEVAKEVLGAYASIVEAFS